MIMKRLPARITYALSLSLLIASLVGLILTTATNRVRAARTSTVAIGPVCSPDPIVANNGNSGAGTLRQAIADACDGSTITFADTVVSPITLGNVLRIDGKSLSIQGPGTRPMTISGNGAHRVLEITDRGLPIQVTFSNLTIADGATVIEPVAAGVYANGDTATVNVINCTITGNSSISGAGGGILNTGTMNIINSTISGNSATQRTLGGAGIFNDGTLNITNSTITGNSTTNRGGGIYNNGGTINVKNSIIAGNPAPHGPDVYNGFNSLGYNLIGKNDGSTGFTNGTNNDQVGSIGAPLDPKLNLLADNGGPTMTHSLRCDSPATDKGFAFTLTTDQRGSARPLDLSNSTYPNASDGSDIGAYEIQAGVCTPIALPPVLQSTNENTPVTMTLTGTNWQGTDLTFTITQQPGHNTAPLTPNVPSCTFVTRPDGAVKICTSTVSYTPTANYFGPDLFKFKVSAGALESGVAQVDINVNSVNDPPVANNDALSDVAEDSATYTIALGTLFANDSPGPANEGSQTLSLSLVGGSELGGTVSSDATNVYFTPAAGYNGPASFQYTVTDNGTTNGAPDPRTSGTATASFTVTEMNDAPTAANDSLGNVAEDSGERTIEFSSLASNDSKGPVNEAGQTLIVKTVSNPVGGTVSIVTGTVRFTPTANYSGPGSFDYTAEDNGTTNGAPDPRTSGTATASFTVTNANDAPTAANDSLGNVGEDSGEWTISFSSLVSNDSKGPADETSESLIVKTVSNPVGGTVSIVAGTVRFTPAANYSGPGSFDYTAEDNGTTDGAPDPQTSGTATASFTVTDVNDAPTAANDSLGTVAEDSGERTIEFSALLSNDSKGPVNEATQTLIVKTVSNPVGGTVSIVAGTVRFTPTANYSGPGSFDYTAEDNGTTDGAPDPLTSGTTIASFTVAEVNDAPGAANDSLGNIAEDSGERTIPSASLTANDSEGPADESGQTLMIKAVSNPVGGTVSIVGGNVLFTPTADHTGPTSFQYTIEDNGQTSGVADPKSDTATVSFSITEVNDAPVPVNDALADIAEDSAPRAIPFADLTANDSKGVANESGQSIVVISANNAVGGTVVVVPGFVVFTPTANYNGPASFNYAVEDNGITNCVSDPKISGPGVVQFNLTESNDAPTAVNDTLANVAQNSGERTIVFADLTANDLKGPADESSQTLIIKTISQPIG
jgi:hypothetical protein